MAFGKRNHAQDIPDGHDTREPEVFEDLEDLDQLQENSSIESPDGTAPVAGAGNTEHEASPGTSFEEEPEMDLLSEEEGIGMYDFAADEPVVNEPSDFEFVSDDTVKDHTMAAEHADTMQGAPAAKTDRRNANAADRRHAKKVNNRKRLGPVMLIIAILIVIVGAIGLKYYQDRSEQVQEQKEEEARAEQTELVVDENISALMTNYYAARVTGEEELLDTYAVPVNDLEKELVNSESALIESYSDITCQRTDGPEKNSYLVAVTANRKYFDAEPLHAEASVYYVKKNANGLYLIDNAYSEFNREYEFNETDPVVLEVVEAYANSDTVKALTKKAQAACAESAKDKAYAAAEKSYNDIIAQWEEKNKAALDAAKGILPEPAKDAAAENADDSSAAEETPAEGTTDTAGTETTDAADTEKTDDASDAEKTDAEQADENADAEKSDAEKSDEEESDDASSEDKEDSDTKDEEEQTEDLPSSVYASEAVRIRLEKDMDADWDQTVYPGDELEVVGYSDGWYHVRTDETEGYVKDIYVMESLD